MRRVYQTTVRDRYLNGVLPSFPNEHSLRKSIMLTCEATLEERIGSAADISPYLMGSNISIEPESRRVVVRGVVNSYYEKQMAQETLLRVDGVESVDNHLEVLRRRCR